MPCNSYYLSRSWVRIYVGLNQAFLQSSFASRREVHPWDWRICPIVMLRLQPFPFPIPDLYEFHPSTLRSSHFLFPMLLYSHFTLKSAFTNFPLFKYIPAANCSLRSNLAAASPQDIKPTSSLYLWEDTGGGSGCGSADSLLVHSLFPYSFDKTGLLPHFAEFTTIGNITTPGNFYHLHYFRHSASNLHKVEIYTKRYTFACALKE